MGERLKPPDRRASYTQKARIENKKYYLGFGEYADGSLCEIFITAEREGTFVRGILDALARMVSVALQCGTPPTEVVKALRNCRFPPNGPVDRGEEDGGDTMECQSLVDWIAQEIEARAYCKKETTA